MEISLIKKIIEEYGLCIWCTGRQIIKDPTKFYEKGAEIYDKLSKKPKLRCNFCDGFFENKEFFKQLNKELSKYEFRTFDVGIMLDSKKIELEDEMRSKYKVIRGLTIKKAILAFSRAMISRYTSKYVDLKNPDLRIYISIRDGKIGYTIKTKTVFLEIRITKQERNVKIRASKCQYCFGKKCSKCNWTGREDDGSLEAFLLFRLPKILGGNVKIRWTVRDFENSIIEGLGRPIYIALRDIRRMLSAPLLVPRYPVKGFLVTLSRTVGKTEMQNIFIQNTRILLKSDRSIDKYLKRLQRNFKNYNLKIIDTPHKVRIRKVFDLKVKRIDENHYVMLIEHETGINLYKFILGPNARKSRMSTYITNVLDNVHLEIENIDVVNVREKDNYY